LAIGLEP
jgi:hypothetical protein